MIDASTLDQPLAELVDRLADAVADRVTERIGQQSTQRDGGEPIDGPAMAEWLKVSQPTLDRMRASGLIPCVRAGRCVRYVPRDVLAALTAQEKGGADT